MMAKSEEWVRVAAESDVQEGHGYETGVEIDGDGIGLFRLGGRYYALGECPHESGPLSQGIIDGHTVTCPWHSARFDIRTGDCLESAFACRVDGNVSIGAAASAEALSNCKTYAVKTENGEIFVRAE